VNQRAEFEAVARAFFAGTASYYDLQDWLASHAQTPADGPDRALEDATIEAWYLLNDYSHGVLTLDDLRREIGSLAAECAAAPSQVS
jgi:hypothetical protein